MTLHEELERIVSLYNIRAKGGFTKACKTFGESLTPPVSASNIWRWCKTGCVPNRRYWAALKHATNIDFSQHDKKKVHRIPVKTVQAAKKAVETHLPVDFQDLQWVYSETPCVGCFIDGGSDECENAVRAITGLECKSRNFVLKRKPIWEVCTKQNTKVGDVVRKIGTGCEWTVKYILANDTPEMMVAKFNLSGAEEYGPMRIYEVEI